MKKLIKFIALLVIILYLASYKNLTINVVKTKEIITVDNVTREVYTSNGNVYYVPCDTVSNWTLFKNLVLLNLDADDDWKALQTPGKHYVRVYGFRTFFSNNKLNIVTILDSLDEKPFLVVLLESSKKIVVTFFISLKNVIHDMWTGDFDPSNR